MSSIIKTLIIGEKLDVSPSSVSGGEVGDIWLDDWFIRLLMAEAILLEFSWHLEIMKNFVD